jgi:hypothetical protein
MYDPNRVAILMPMRLHSTRLQQKLLFTLANGFSIARQAMRLAKDFAGATGFHPLVACAEYELIDLANEEGIEVFERNEQSITDTTDDARRFEGWADRLRPRFDWVFWINPCFPLMTNDILLESLAVFCDRPVRFVTKRFDAIFEADDPATLNKELRPSGKINKARPWGLITHHAMIIPVSYFDRPVADWFITGEYDLCYTSPGVWLMDVDTPEDWYLVQLVDAAVSGASHEA